MGSVTLVPDTGGAGAHRAVTEGRIQEQYEEAFSLLACSRPARCRRRLEDGWRWEAKAEKGKGGEQSSTE
jgi:hypothetical protein